MPPEVSREDNSEKVRREIRHHRQILTLTALGVLVAIVVPLGVATGWKFPPLSQLFAVGTSSPSPKDSGTAVPDWKPGEKPRLQRIELYTELVGNNAKMKNGGIYGAPSEGVSVSFSYQGRFNDNSIDDGADCDVIIRISGPSTFDQPSQTAKGCDSANSGKADWLEFDYLTPGDYTISVVDRVSKVQSIYSLKVLK